MLSAIPTTRRSRKPGCDCTWIIDGCKASTDINKSGLCGLVEEGAYDLANAD